MITTILVYAGIPLVLLLAWINGANNAGNVIGVAVGARSISAKRALQLAFIFEIVGAVLLGHYVSTTIMRGIIDPAEISREILVIGVLIIASSSTIWMFIATYLRVPLSVTQAVVGGIVGFGLVTLGVNGVAWSRLVSILFSWILTLLLAVLISLLLYKLYTTTLLYVRSNFTLLSLFSSLLYTCIAITLLLVTSSIDNLLLSLTMSLLAPIPLITLYTRVIKRTMSRDHYEARYSINKHLLLVSASLAAFSHGAHDVGASAGLLQLLLFSNLTSNVENLAESNVSKIVLLVSGFTIALGMLKWGYRVLGTIAERITPLTPESGFTAQLSAAFTMLVVTRMGFPSSTTLAITGAIIGVGLSRGGGYVNVETIMRVFTTWILSFPATLLLSLIIGVLTIHFIL